ncbi:hypothetical protein SAMN06296241_1360 [Salinimicrobium sediminis]|uniref:Uncharacterized protein n=1 Tax=Salinimicrobium sediminis TaxID=1343891 RepID=A0A285X3A6_9FLAO|nr:hypothetical protein [Salinimicrobium sediminis]SOC79823.1 hypothetical protein SAMN06296241_1360 [Salinimicrobium sediminis]
MAILDLAALTMNAEEAKDVSQAIFERTITGGDLSEFHEVVTGIEHKTQIPFIGNLGLVGTKVTGCDRNENPAQISLTEKFWDPALIGDRLAHCATDVNALFKLFKKAQKVNPDFYDRIGGEEFGVIISKVEQAMKKMNNRLVWFGDTAALNVTGGGVIKDGVDVKYFNVIDGLWKQILAEVPTTAKNYVAISQNAGAGYAAQALPADYDALGLFRKMHDAIDARFFEAMDEGAEPQYLVTREIFQRFQAQLEDKSLAFTLAETKDGVNGLSYRGITIKVRHDWDNNIRSYQDNGTKWNLPHRALLTVKENIPVGTLSEADLNNIESWYEKKDKKNYIDFDLKLDAKHLLDYMTVAAY